MLISETRGLYRFYGINGVATKCANRMVDDTTRDLICPSYYKWKFYFDDEESLVVFEFISIEAFIRWVNGVIQEKYAGTYDNDLIDKLREDYETLRWLISEYKSEIFSEDVLAIQYS